MTKVAAKKLFQKTGMWYIYCPLLAFYTFFHSKGYLKCYSEISHLLEEDFGAYFLEQFYQLSLSVFVICEGMSPNDVQVVELHDCFSTNELLTYEGLGLCSEGMMGYSLSICYLVLA